MKQPCSLNEMIIATHAASFICVSVLSHLHADDDLSEQSSGPETPVSRDTEDGKKKKKTKGKKKEKKNKGKKKGDDSGDELEKKPKKKGFGLLR